MQTADPREADDAGGRAGTLLDRTPGRRVLADAEVCPVLIVVGDEGSEQLLADGGDEALGDAVLPRAPVARPGRLHLHRPQRRRHSGREEGIAVEDHETRRRLERKGLAKLLRYPGSGRARRDGAADHRAAAVADDEKNMEGAERRGGHREEVHHSDAVSVVPEECRPGLARSRRSRQSAQVAGDTALGDLEAQAQQLSVDAGGAPALAAPSP